MGNDILMLAISAVIGYLLGSINSSIIIGRAKGADIREKGSGNAGMANTLRTFGKSAAILVTAGDVAKGILACLAGMLLAGGNGVMVAGFAAVAGHNWPLYFGFKGGKGALTSIAVVFIMDWRLALIVLGVFLVTLLIFRYFSLGSIAGSVAFPILAILFGKPLIFIIFAFLIGGLAVARHYPNIQRLIAGTERKITFGKGKNPSA